MPSEQDRAHVNWQRRTEPANLPEWMDQPCTLDELRACLHDLGRVNTLTLGYRPTLQFLDRIVTAKKPSAPLKILDVGFGGGDILHRIAAWAKTRSIPVQLTGIDLNPLAAHLARERFGDSSIEWLTGDALSYTGGADLVLSSLLTHHLATSDLLRYIRWMEERAALGWFVNDLERSARSASLFAALSRVMRWHRFVRHDGPVSFARSFVRADWNRMLAQAEVPLEAATIAQSFPARLCVSRLK